MGEYGPSVLPETLKSSTLDMYWLKQFSYRYTSKKTLNKYHSGELSSETLSPANYRNLLLASGENKKSADIKAAKLHLEQRRNK